MPLKTYKHLSLLLLSILTVFVVSAQLQNNKPNSSTIPTVAPGNIHTPGTYTGNNLINYIRTVEALGPYTDQAALTTADYQHAKQTTDYFDGLGRPLQTVARQATAGSTPKDIVTPVEYDAFGREQYKYMSYIANASTGAFRTTAFTEQKTYLETQYTSPAEKVFYTKINFESSPLNRLEKTMPQGNSWAGNNIGIDQKYMTNTTADAVVMWNITTNALTYTGNDESINIPVPASGTYYATGQLYKNVTIDESNNAIVEYMNKQDQVVLKKVQVSTIASDYSGYTGFLSTYYIYDDLGNLRFVIPPKAVEAIRSNWTLTGNNSLINEGCFRYEYNGRKQVIAKKTPGAGWIYLIYDTRDRLVFMQDANMRTKNQWLTTLYDGLNRMIMTGITTWAGNPGALQTAVKTTTAAPAIPAGTLADRNLPLPTNGDYVATNSISMETGFEAAVNGTSFTASILSEAQSVEGTIVNRNPIPEGAPFIALTLNYYDNYSWTNKTYITAYNTQLDAGTSPYINLHGETLPSAASTKTMGLLTGTKTRLLNDPNNLGAGQWMTTAHYYDDDARIIQMQSDNHKNDQDIVTMMYDFNGKILCTYLVHKNPEAGTSTLRIKTSYYYDHAGRLLKTWKTINDEIAKKTLIASNEYDDLGQLKKKELGQKKDPITGVYTTTPIETLDYTYNVRGWLQGLNKDYVADQGTGSRSFGMELNYDWGFASNRLNGNLAGTKWRSKGNGEKRSYGYSYDAANRILGADFAQSNGTNYVDNSAINFDMVMGNTTLGLPAYDENGNIRAMQQWGRLASGSNQIDNLVYEYSANSNKLRYVKDLSTAANNAKLGDFTDKHATDDDDYGYDKNGNLTTDLNKGLNGTTGIDQTTGGAILYNHLNLPWQITVPGKGTITYIYDADGSKLQKKTEEELGTGEKVTTITDYFNDFIYESKSITGGTKPAAPEENYQGHLLFIAHEEGRIRYIAEGSPPAPFVYDYFVKDHLGNVRVTLTDEIKKAQYLASLETAYRTKENLLFANVETTAFPKASIPNYPDDQQPVTDPNLFVSKTNGSDNKVGPAIVLKVMSGDQIQIGVRSLYKDITASGTSSSFTDVLNTLAAGIVSASGDTKGAVAELTTSGSQVYSALQSFITNNNGSVTGKPKAYLNWLFLDEQLNYVQGESGAVPVGNYLPNQLNTLAQSLSTINKNGYLYIYVNNETQGWDVFFDNLEVIHTPGPLLEENHYYPFGGQLSGICSKAAGKLENKYKHAGKELQSGEFSDGSGLEQYDFGSRFYDPQIGRWHTQDPMTDKWHEYTPYTYTLNNPINLVDLDGEDIYILYYTIENDHGDEMFKAAAETRKKNIEEGENFDPEKDKVIMVGVQDISDIQDMTKWAIEVYSDKYGKTAEAGVWSHSGVDGPIGTKPAQKDPYSEGATQMSLAGWGKIDYNWKDKGTTMGFYGCNSGNEKAKKNFAQNISGLDNYKNVEVRGQSTSSFPSFYTNIRATSIGRSYKWPGAWQIGGTYMVGGNQGDGGKAISNVPTGKFPAANPMNVYRNRQKLRSDFQPGKQKK